MIESIVLKNKTTLQSVLFDKEVSEFILDTADLGTVKGTHHSYSYLNQVGVYIDSTTSVSYTHLTLPTNREV